MKITIIGILLIAIVNGCQGQTDTYFTNPYPSGDGKLLDTIDRRCVLVDSFLIRYVFDPTGWMDTLVGRMICDSAGSNCREDTAGYRENRHYYARIRVYRIEHGQQVPVGQEFTGYYVPVGCFEDVAEERVKRALAMPYLLNIALTADSARSFCERLAKMTGATERNFGVDSEIYTDSILDGYHGTLEDYDSTFSWTRAAKANYDTLPDLLNSTFAPDSLPAPATGFDAFHIRIHIVDNLGRPLQGLEAHFQIVGGTAAKGAVMTIMGLDGTDKNGDQTIAVTSMHPGTVLVAAFIGKEQIWQSPRTAIFINAPKSEKLK